MVRSKFKGRKDMTTAELRQLQEDMEAKEMHAANMIVGAGCLIGLLALAALLVQI